MESEELIDLGVFVISIYLDHNIDPEEIVTALEVFLLDEFGIEDAEITVSRT